MVKETQTIRRLLADELFEFVWLFYGVRAWRVNHDTDLSISEAVVKHFANFIRKHLWRNFLKKTLIHIFPWILRNF